MGYDRAGDIIRDAHGEPMKVTAVNPYDLSVSIVDGQLRVVENGIEIEGEDAIAAAANLRFAIGPSIFGMALGQTSD